MQEKPRKPMSRGEATFLIIAAIVVAALFINREIARNDPNDPWAECTTIFGGKTTECMAEVSGRRLDGNY